MLKINTDNNIEKIRKWMMNYQLKLVPEKTEALLLRGKQKREEVTFTVEDITIRPSKTLKYLGITTGDRGTFSKHLRLSITSAE